MDTEQQQQRQIQPTPIGQWDESRVRFISPGVVDDDGLPLSVTVDSLSHSIVAALVLAELFVGYLWKCRDPKRDLHLLFVSPRFVALSSLVHTAVSRAILSGRTRNPNRPVHPSTPFSQRFFSAEQRKTHLNRAGP